MREIRTYKTGSFTGFDGKERQIVICGVSYDIVADVCYNTGSYESAVRELAIGIACCNPVDEYDIEIGKDVAYHKALNPNNNRIMCSSHRGMFTDKIVNDILENECDYVCKHPESALYSYRLAKNKYEQLKQAKFDYAELSSEQQTIVDSLIECQSIKKLEEIAAILKDA